MQEPEGNRSLENLTTHPESELSYRLLMTKDGCYSSATLLEHQSELTASIDHVSVKSFDAEDECWTQLAESTDEDVDLDLYRYLYEGLIFPKGETLMVRCRMSGGELSSQQVTGIAQIATEYGGGYADITTRGNLQIRDVAIKDGIKVLKRLVELEIAPAAAGVNNLRNVTSTPTTGFDADELINVLPIARELSRALIFHQSLQGLPGKFNMAIDSGGAVSVCADTNDLGFYAVKDERGVHFRMKMAGGDGLKGLAVDVGYRILPEEVVPVAAAVIKVFLEQGDFTKRLRSRLKYLVADKGIEKVMQWVKLKLAFSLEESEDRASEMIEVTKLDDPHYGVNLQRGGDKHYIGVVVPAGRLRCDQLLKIAELADSYGQSVIRVTVKQNFLLPSVSGHEVQHVQNELLKVGLQTSRLSFAAGMVACTGSVGCHYSATDTKRHSQEVAKKLDQMVVLDQAVNIHFTGCSFSCAQPYVGDIGLLGARWKVEGVKHEGYHLSVGGGADGADVGRQLFTRVQYGFLADQLAHILLVFQKERQAGESFNEFTRRHDVEKLREIFQLKGGCRV